jgi:IS5 family transposase
VDALLDDPVFFTPFVRLFDPRMGRPSTPMETYVRLMFLKFRHRLGFESLCPDVSDSITWRQFCRIGLDQPVPHPTTLMKLTTRCGSAAVDGLNEALLAKAAEAKLLRCTRIRVETTVVTSNVAYPTDSGLLAKAVRRIDATGGRLQAPGGAVRTRLRNRSRAAGRRAHDLNAKLRTRSATANRRRWMWCAARTLSWPRRPPWRPNGCWPMRSGRCGRPGRRRPIWPQQAARAPLLGAAVAGSPGRSTSRCPPR